MPLPAPQATMLARRYGFARQQTLMRDGIYSVPRLCQDAKRVHLALSGPFLGMSHARNCNICIMRMRANKVRTKSGTGGECKRHTICRHNIGTALADDALVLAAANLAPQRRDGTHNGADLGTVSGRGVGLREQKRADGAGVVCLHGARGELEISPALLRVHKSRSLPN